MFSRRSLLAGCLAVGNAHATAGVPIGAHLWVFAAKLPGYDPTPVLDQVFAEFSAAGIDGLELMHHVLLHDGIVPRLSELSKRHRLPVWGTSWSAAMWQADRHTEIVDQGTLVIRRLHQAGGKHLGISVGDAGRRKTEAELDAQAAVLKKIFSVAESEGIVPNLHNHTYEVRDGEWDMNGTLARIPSAKLGPDFAWLHRAGVDPVDFAKRHGKRIVYGHLRQELPGPKWPETMEEGVIDYAAVAAALKQAGFNGALAIELAHERDFTPTQSYGESLRKSRLYVKKTMGW